MVGMIYSRFDLSSSNQLCRRSDEVISIDQSAVMLSPSAFMDSGKYSFTEETSNRVKE